MSALNGPILLTGVNGQVGGQLLPLLKRFGDVIAPGRDELDLADAEGVRAFVRRTAPRLIVNPAAYTLVDKAESEKEIAFAINATAPKVLGEEAALLDAPVLHFSTDYVFDGGGTTPWVETDHPEPLGVYGASKLAGEQALAGSGATHLIFRTSWVYGTTGNNFLRTILRLARERNELKIVADQYGAPTWSRELARLVEYTIRMSEAKATKEGCSLVAAVKPFEGIYHACNAGTTTWFGFAEAFIAMAKLAEPGVPFASLLQIPSQAYPTPAKRPANSRMNCAKLASTLGFVMPTWQSSLAQVMAEAVPVQAGSQRDQKIG